MATFTDAAADAAEAEQALRGLAHATRTIRDPQTLYPVLGSLSQAAASLEQALHQLAACHEDPTRRPLVDGDARAGRAAGYQAAWELHRAAEIMRQISASLDHAHEVEGSIAPEAPSLPRPPSPSPSPSPSMVERSLGW